MRKIIFSLLLASVAVSPAMAKPDRGDRPDQQTDRADRQEARDQARAQRSDDGNRPARSFDGNRADRPQVDGNRPERPQFDGNRPDRPRFDGNRGDRNQFGGQRPSFGGQAPSPEQVQAWRDRQGGDGTARWNRDNVQRSGETSHWTRQPGQQPGETQRWTRERSSGWSQPGGTVDQREAWRQRQPTADNRRWSGTWNRDWRNDRRYDWRRYRDQHRSTFRIGLYFDPFGYSYRRYDIGYRMSPAYYGQRYWFDPGMYGLPYPPPGTQWIRYWDDALLVDIYSGQVIDAIPNFFW